MLFRSHHCGDQQRPHFWGSGLFLNDDAQQWPRAVKVVRQPLDKGVNIAVQMLLVFKNGDAVGTCAAGVFKHVLPCGDEFVTCDGGLGIPRSFAGDLEIMGLFWLGCKGLSLIFRPRPLGWLDSYFPAGVEPGEA